MADDFLISDMDISKLKVPDLKRELKLRGLSSSGNKNELVERLQNALKLMDNTSAESVDDLDDDLLNDDDLDHEHLDPSESVLNDLDHLDTPERTQIQKRKVSKTDLPDLDSKSSKRIILNRSESVLSNSEKTNSDDSPSDQINEKLQYPTKSEEETKVIKLSDLSAKERLEMRAKKFGTLPSAEAKKVARAERFSGSIVLPSSPVETNLEALKKRAERFGGSVSKALSSVEQQERLKKRKERFGIVTTSNGTTSQNGKAQQRLERFKAPVV